LADVANALLPPTHEDWAAMAKVVIIQQQARVFCRFVLSHYLREGVHELDQEKLTPWVRLRYNIWITDSLADLGCAEGIGQAFAGFQRYRYQRSSAPSAIARLRD
jgi:type I restriction enzyme R subunit